MQLLSCLKLVSVTGLLKASHRQLSLRFNASHNTWHRPTSVLWKPWMISCDITKVTCIQSCILASPLFDPNPPVGKAKYALYVDADNSSNPSRGPEQTERHVRFCFWLRSQRWSAPTGRQGWQTMHQSLAHHSKFQSFGIAFATPHIGEHHVGCGSGENEIYGLANACDEILFFSYMVKIYYYLRICYATSKRQRYLPWAVQIDHESRTLINDTHALSRSNMFLAYSMLHIS